MTRMKRLISGHVPSYEGACRFEFLLLAAVLFCFVYNSGCYDKSSGMARIGPNEERHGIQVESIRVSAEGYMLDFRYRVVDKTKAEDLFSKDMKPYIIDQKSGARLIVPSPPKVGSLSQTSNPPVEGKIYFILFANPGRIVKSGDKVTVVVGDMEIKDISVNQLYGRS